MGARVSKRSIENHEAELSPRFGDGQWNDERSMELQASIDEILSDNLCKLAFSCVIADPMQHDCPIVAMSIGFATLTGYPASEVIGRNCRFLLAGVPDCEVNAVMRMKARAFCKISDSGDFLYDVDSKDGPLLDIKEDEKLFFLTPKGELHIVQTNARKTGELFQNMFFMKHIRLDDEPFILALQAEVSDKAEMVDDFIELSQNMYQVDQLLTSRFWYSAPMGRQF